ncbi:MAG: hypothetical protein AAF921_02615 [Cyanobacteria bacterium P01_D01_bin.44]
MTNGPIDQPMSNDELRALVASNARAIAALAEENRTGFAQVREENRAGFAQVREELQREISDVTSMIASNAEEIAQTQATVQETSQQVQILIEEGKADRAEAQQQRQVNASEHAAFREQFQSLLLSFTQEIRQIWQRLSA